MYKHLNKNSVVVVGLLAALTFVGLGAGADKALTLEQVPGPARAALLALVGGARITEVEIEKEHGAMVYEVEWSANGVEYEAAVTAEGALLETEETIAVADAPAAVRALIAERFGPNTQVKVEKITIFVYEVEGKVNGQEVELVVFPTGRVHEGAGQGSDSDSSGSDSNSDGLSSGSNSGAEHSSDSNSDDGR